ncbi:hypothetical protein D3C71_2139760 [compost metagenome]
MALPNRDVPKAFVGDQEIPKAAVPEAVKVARPVPKAFAIDPFKWAQVADQVVKGAPEPEVW